MCIVYSLWSVFCMHEDDCLKVAKSFVCFIPKMSSQQNGNVWPQEMKTADRLYVSISIVVWDFVIKTWTKLHLLIRKSSICYIINRTRIWWMCHSKRVIWFRLLEPYQMIVIEFFSHLGRVLFIPGTIEAWRREVTLRDKKMHARCAFDSHSSFCCDWNSSWNVQMLIWDAMYCVH